MLESLRLAAADAEPSSRDDIDALVFSVCQLTKLTALDICQTSDYFRSPEIRRIATCLKGLETLKFTGYDVTDDVWYSFSGYVSDFLPQSFITFERFGFFSKFSGFQLFNFNDSAHANFETAFTTCEL